MMPLPDFSKYTQRVYAMYKQRQAVAMAKARKGSKFRISHPDPEVPGKTLQDAFFVEDTDRRYRWNSGTSIYLIGWFLGQPAILTMCRKYQSVTIAFR